MTLMAKKVKKNSKSPERILVHPFTKIRDSDNAEKKESDIPTNNCLKEIEEWTVFDVFHIYDSKSVNIDN